MAKAILSNAVPIITKKIEQENFAKIIKFNYGSKITKINQTLPFRVRFTSITVEGLSPTNVPPIPLQVIGYSNYIL